MTITIKDKNPSILRAREIGIALRIINKRWRANEG